jgi:GAF domain-containing protein
MSGVKALVRRFRPPQDTQNESLCFAALHILHILDTLPEERFDRITREVQMQFAVPLVFVSLVDRNRQWFKSKQWACPVPEVTETGRDVSFCGHAIQQDKIMIVNDALLDDRFADNPLVTGDLRIRFYAGVPLSVPDKDGNPSNIGTLCIIDHRPRELSEDEVKILKEYAQQVKRELLRLDSIV